jgi:hypothetical protein
MNSSRLIGRYTAGSGVMEEIKIGTNLSLSTNILNASTATAVSSATNLFNYYNFT